MRGGTGGMTYLIMFKIREEGEEIRQLFVFYRQLVSRFQLN